jgi:hypothetical protein
MNQNINENLHCQSETKIAKRLLPGTQPTYNKKEKTHKKVFGRLQVTALLTYYVPEAAQDLFKTNSFQ